MEKTDEFNTQVVLKKFGYRRCKYHDRSFHLIKRLEEKSKTEAVGDYIILSPKESAFISEKKVDNLVNLLNEDPLINIGDTTKTLTLFEHVVDDEDEEGTGSSGSGSGAYIMRSLKEEGISTPEARISLIDEEALNLFENGVQDYCDSLSTTENYRSTALYGAPKKVASRGMNPSPRS